MARRDLTWIPRLLGAATAAYSVAITAKPELFLRPTKLLGDGEQPDAGQRALTMAIGGRDLASGLAMLFAPAGTPLKTAVAVRVGADVADLAVLGSQLPDRDAREKATMVAAGWGALCALSILAADRPRR
ncbi:MULTISPECIES: hypothetical protein [unclassified Pseudonocardia]|uniref:hypothetical protein n=1 Tax=unclassified Pseudonocardia TaxID=2619320 RepID=UPI0001FFE16E|nr:MULTISPECIES: hypothetical protein [unclassified Pseudonocardia]ALE75686.1 hypothetical protein FRP1_27515 [Pseudonocardia sp. EC080625-04]ALL75068.1 hypothetical protein AD006_06695 [Pseudonocardia sp. EC080610-09]ALL82090.1 hypothetical protein AD017_14510 [Pseudonocardia sp. EC080619-01]OLM21271.1 hypothetical protein Ae707Ps1_5530c [Pseudonocardia sp. Ae707_Ps1]